MATTVQKDPAAILDYGLDWSSWLQGDTITASDWFITGPDADLAFVPERPAQVDGARTKVWIFGGTLEQVYALVNRIQTLGGRTDERTLNIAIRDK